MISFIFTLLSALSISIIAAYFSIVGLTAIFPGGGISIIIMGVVLEVGKIITILWLHQNWKSASKLIKLYFCFAVLVLMFITSLGIFGFLSKSHIEHKARAETERDLIKNVEEKINREKESILSIKKSISNIQENSKDVFEKYNLNISIGENKINILTKKLKEDEAVELSMLKDLRSRVSELDMELSLEKQKKSGLFSNKDKKIKEVIESQFKEREKIEKEIKIRELSVKEYRQKYEDQYNYILKTIEETKLNDKNSETKKENDILKFNSEIEKHLLRLDDLFIEKNKYGQIIRTFEAEIGPLSYFIAFFNDFLNFRINQDQGVTILIIIIISVFDPLAILLIVAAQIIGVKLLGLKTLSRSSSKVEVLSKIRNYLNKN
jgi:hypothetical protein